VKNILSLSDSVKNEISKRNLKISWSVAGAKKIGENTVAESSFPDEEKKTAAETSFDWNLIFPRKTKNNTSNCPLWWNTGKKYFQTFFCKKIFSIKNCFFYKFIFTHFFETKNSKNIFF
jgi:hypothetical protein